jgi:molecular chaperone GrpE
MTDAEDQRPEARASRAAAAAEEEPPFERQPPPAEDELARMEDRYKRAVADLDNYRKRVGRELEGRLAEGRDALLRDWLEAVDSVERALHSLRDDADDSGLRSVLGQMEAILARYGVQRVGSVGEPFDPARHEAVEVRERDDVPDRTIVDVVRSGYAVGGRVVRPALVVVSRVPGLAD